MKKARLFLVGALMSGFIVVSAAPASANCKGDPILPANPCVVICEIGQGNKYTKDLFSFCEVW